MKDHLSPGAIHYIRSRSYEDMSREAARIMMEQLVSKADSLFTLATGATPERSYELFRENIRRENLSTGELRIHKLDEWAGISMQSAASCETYIKRTILDPLNITPGHYIGINGEADDPAKECIRIDQQLAKEGPVQLSLLGLGVNGHLGLNEPADVIHPDTHTVTLSEESRHHSMLAGEQPDMGMTTGMRGILSARHILFLVSGESKEAVFKQFLGGEVTSRVPATFLHLHQNVTCIVNESSFSAEILKELDSLCPKR